MKRWALALVLTAPALAQGQAPAPPPAPAPTNVPAPANAPAPAEAPAPEPVLVARADQDGIRAVLRAMSPSIEVGEPLVLRLEVEAPPSASIRFDQFVPQAGARPALGDFDVRSARLLPADPSAPERHVQELEVVTFASGVVEIPPVQLIHRSSDGSEQRLAVGPLRIEVRSLVGDVEDPRTALRPVKEAVEIQLPVDWRRIAAISAIGVILLALAFAAWRLLRRPKTPVTLLPHERARQALEELRDENLPNRGRVLDFYVRLADIVRGYVEQRFGIRAPEQTTKEFLAAASHHASLHDEHRSLLASFLRSADRVKFAAERPASSDCTRAFDAASGFVEETVPADAQSDSDLAEVSA